MKISQAQVDARDHIQNHLAQLVGAGDMESDEALMVLLGVAAAIIGSHPCAHCRAKLIEECVQAIRTAPEIAAQHRQSGSTQH